MEPSRERFERSIPWEEEKMIELLDNFKTEMLRKFQEQEQKIAEQEERILTQEEKNVEQDVKIGRQSETISQLEETIAEQNQMIQMIAKHLDFGNFLQGFKTGASPGKPLGKFKCSVLTQILYRDFNNVQFHTVLILQIQQQLQLPQKLQQ